MSRETDFVPIVPHTVFDMRSSIHSLRRCPECSTAMYTNGKGLFWCMYCQYRDEKDVSKYEALGYRGDARHVWGKLNFKGSKF